MIAAVVFVGALCFVLGVTVAIAFQRPRVRQMQRDVDNLTGREALEAAKPHELVRVRHVHANGVAWSVAARKLEHVDELVRSWATLELEPFELGPGELLQGELLTDELEVRRLFVVRAKPILEVRP